MFGQYGDRFQTRAPPPTGRPPRYALSRYVRSNLRPVIIGIGILSCAYALLWGGSNFDNLRFDGRENLGQLIPFDIALGTAYMVVALIEIIGIVGAVKQNSTIIGHYFKLSLVASVIVLGAEILRLIVHFKYKDALISSCKNAVQNDGDNRISFFGNRNRDGLTEAQADDFCHDAWNHDTFSDIAWLLLSTILSLLFASLAYSYYRQLLDPTFGMARPRPEANAGNNVPLDTFNTYGHYAQGHGLGYNNNNNNGASSSRPPSEYAPPYEGSKLPGYGGYAEEVDPDKKASDNDKALAGVNH